MAIDDRCVEAGKTPPPASRLGSGPHVRVCSQTRRRLSAVGEFHGRHLLLHLLTLVFIIKTSEELREGEKIDRVSLTFGLTFGLTFDLTFDPSCKIKPSSIALIFEVFDLLLFLLRQRTTTSAAALTGSRQVGPQADRSITLIDRSIDELIDDQRDEALMSSSVSWFQTQPPSLSATLLQRRSADRPHPLP